jgi:hypothetical protein
VERNRAAFAVILRAEGPKDPARDEWDLSLALLRRKDVICHPEERSDEGSHMVRVGSLYPLLLFERSEPVAVVTRWGFGGGD